MRRAPNSRVGLTLVETLVTLTVVGVLLLLGSVSVRGSTRAADSRSVALMLQAELKAARSLARSEQRPISVRFPSNGGASSHSSWIYLEAGQVNPAIVRRTALSGPDSPVCVFVGHGGLDGGGVNGIDRPASHDFSFSDWDLSNNSDPALVTWEAVWGY